MTTQPPNQHSSAFLAYKLGYNSIWLPFLAELFWQNARMDVSFDEVDPPGFLGDLVEEIQFSVEQLSGLVPASKRSAPKLNVGAHVIKAWQDYKTSWRSPDHLERIEERDAFRGELAYQIMLENPPLKNWAWTRIPSAVRKLLNSLTPTLQTFAAIGSAIAAVIPAEEGHTRVVVELQNVLIKAREVELLRGLDLDFSRERFVRDSRECKDGSGYVAWAREKASGLNDQIAERFTTASSVAREPRYISSKEAEALSEALGVPLSCSQISKLSKKDPKPFESIKFTSQRLEIELSSFLVFLYDEMKRRKKPEQENDTVAQRIVEDMKRRAAGRESLK
jgi:hypothetical protein